ncbi:Nucleotide exchange factor SIL1 [Chelonia mydas]|uniref:Nucleotide exchange factor SIL1 n=1 Tax=Chelonia mydas TaxID=8469 RepID=M7BGN8_CHEMY|nr:Nucleotide exchange factor SIL1 [Chelonia mydas]
MRTYCEIGMSNTSRRTAVTEKEFALTKTEESDLKEENNKESVAEDDLDPEDLEVFYPTYQWQTVRPGKGLEQQSSNVDVRTTDSPSPSRCSMELLLSQQ